MKQTLTTTAATAAATTTAATDILNDDQAAPILGITPRTLRLWRHTRGVPHLRLTSKVIRYRRADLDKWLDSHRVQIRVS